MKSAFQRLIPLAAGLLTSLAAHAAPAAYPTPGHQAPESSFVATANGDLVAYYTGLAGGYVNLVGVSINGVDGIPGLNNHTSAYGQTYVLGHVNAGDSLVFFLDATDYANVTTRYYSQKSLNVDQLNHAWATSYAGDAVVPAGVHIAFEDIRSGGDLNYGDHGIVVATVLATAVPEPASWALLLGGVAGLAVLRRRAR